MTEESEYALRNWHHMPKHPVGIDCLKSDIGGKIHLGRIENRCVDIVYHGLFEPITSRRIEPIELFRRGDHNYIYAYCHLEEEVRCFRIDRIFQAELTGQPNKHLYRKPVIFRRDSTTKVNDKRHSVKQFYSLMRALIPYIVITIFILILFFYRNK